MYKISEFLFEKFRFFFFFLVVKFSIDLNRLVFVMHSGVQAYNIQSEAKSNSTKIFSHRL